MRPRTTLLKTIAKPLTAQGRRGALQRANKNRTKMRPKKALKARKALMPLSKSEKGKVRKRTTIKVLLRLRMKAKQTKTQ